MKKRIFGALMLCLGFLSCSEKSSVADYRVIPLPQEIVKEQGDGFVLDKSTSIVYTDGAEMKRNAEFLAEFIKENTGLELATVMSNSSMPKAINLVIGNSVENMEGYCLTADNNRIEIVSSSPAGHAP